MGIGEKMRTRLMSGGTAHSVFSGLVRRFSWTFFAKALGILVTFCFHIALSRILGADGYGEYVYVITWVTILALIGAGGFNTASMKFISSFVKNRQWALLKGFLRYSSLVSLSFAAVIMILGTVLLQAMGQRGIKAPFAFKYGLFLIPLYVYLNLLIGRLRGVKRPVISELIFSSIRPLIILSMVILYGCCLRSDQPNAATVLVFEGGGVIGLICWAVYLQNSGFDVSLRQERCTFQSGKWLEVAFPMMFLAVFHMINSRADIVVIGFFCNNADIAAYNAAAKIAALAPLGLVAVNDVMAPIISQSQAKEEMAELQRQVKITAWVSIFFCVPVIIGIIFLKSVLFNLFGPMYAEAGKMPLTILLVCQVVNILSGPVGILLTMTGFQKEATKMMAYSAVINLGLNFGLVPRMGISGAALATGISTLFWNISMLGIVLSNLKINPTVFPLKTNFKRA